MLKAAKVLNMQRPLLKREMHLKLKLKLKRWMVQGQMEIIATRQMVQLIIIIILEYNLTLFNELKKIN